MNNIEKTVHEKTSCEASSTFIYDVVDNSSNLCDWSEATNATDSNNEVFEEPDDHTLQGLLECVTRDLEERTKLTQEEIDFFSDPEVIAFSGEVIVDE